MRFKQKPEVLNDRKNENKEQLAKDFLSKADMPATFQHNDGADYSGTWKDMSVKKEVTTFSFRIPKKDMQQLKYISKQTGISLNALCLMSIQANNRKMLKEIEENQ